VWAAAALLVLAAAAVAYRLALAPGDVPRSTPEMSVPAASDDGRVDADAVEGLPLPTPYGPLRVWLGDAAETGRPVRASCRCELPAELLGVALSDVEASAEGTLDGAHFVGTVTVRGVSVDIDAALGGAALAAGTFELPATAVDRLYGVIREAVPELDRAEMRGVLSGTGDFTLEPRMLHVRPRVEGLAVDGLVSADYRVGSVSFRGRDATGQPVAARTGEGTPGWIALAEVGPMLPMAVIGAEDAGFYRHSGYDLAGMLDAAKANEAEGKVVRGGSTLSQQLAKNLFLSPERSYARKARELLYAVEMERELGKERILELYLNVVEWGPDLRGARAASEAYFLKQPAGLLPEEAAFLASILRNPRGGWAKQYRDGRVETRRLKWILDNMAGLSPEERAAALSREVHFVPPAAG
jgi:hypothetical protein